MLLQSLQAVEWIWGSRGRLRCGHKGITSLSGREAQPSTAVASRWDLFSALAVRNRNDQFQIAKKAIGFNFK
jgi:hypothetical protein